MRVNLQPAYLLHSRGYRDSSLIVEVITPEYGRLSLVARGARRRRRGGSQGSMLQPFVPLLLSFSGRSEMKNLVASEVARAALVLRGERLFSALYLNELTMRLLHRHDPHPQLFAAYGEALLTLQGDQAFDVALRRFEWALLDELGYAFALDRDGSNNCAVRSDARYHYQPGCGLVEHDTGTAARNVRDRVASYSGAHLLAMAGGEIQGEVRQTAKGLLREALANLLGPQPLRSRELFQSVSAHVASGDSAGQVAPPQGGPPRSDRGWSE